MLYPNYEDVLELHSQILKYSSGLDGLRDEKLLRSCLEWIQDDAYYVTFEEKLTHLVYSIAMGHVFVDANKRTSIILGAYFIYLNDFSRNCADGFPRYMENVVLRLAKGEISKAELQEMITGYLKSLSE